MGLPRKCGDLLAKKHFSNKNLPTLSSVSGACTRLVNSIELCKCLTDSKNLGNCKVIFNHGRLNPVHKIEQHHQKYTDLQTKATELLNGARRKISPTAEVHRSCKRNPDARSVTSPEPTNLLPLFPWRDGGCRRLPLAEAWERLPKLLRVQFLTPQWLVLEVSS